MSGYDINDPAYMHSMYLNLNGKSKRFMKSDGYDLNLLFQVSRSKLSVQKSKFSLSPFVLRPCYAADLFFRFAGETIGGESTPFITHGYYVTITLSHQDSIWPFLKKSTKIIWTTMPSM